MVKSSSFKKQIFSIKKARFQRKWKKEEDQELIHLVKKYKERNWKEIASNFVNKNPLQCFSRFKRIKPGIKKGSWKIEEDKIILELVEKYSRAWSKISKEMKTRNSKQIRDRYLNVLDPGIDRSKFSEEDDKLILNMYKTNGPKWGNIATFFHYRTADMIKNRFYSSIKKRFLLNADIQEESNVYNLNCNSQCNGISANSLHGLNSQNQVYLEDKEETKECTGVFDTDFFGRESRCYCDFNENWSRFDSMTD